MCQASIDKDLETEFDAVGPMPLPSPAHESVSAEVQALGWGVTLEVTLPHQTPSQGGRAERDKIVSLKEGSDNLIQVN